MNISSIISSIAGQNTGLLKMMGQAYQVAQGMQKSRTALLDYINKNNAKISEMLPYLDEGRPVRSVLDKYLPGMASRIQEEGKILMKDQEQSNPTSASSPTSSTSYPDQSPSTQPGLGYRILPLKNRKN